MNLADKLAQDYIASYKAHESVKLGVLRMLKTAMTNRLVELKNPGGQLDDNEILSLILKQAKQRKDSIEQYTAANRRDLAEKETAELAILEAYLPRQLDPAEIDDAIMSAIAETGAKSTQEMGKVMGIIMAKYKGRIDGKQASALIREKLSQN